MRRIIRPLRAKTRNPHSMDQTNQRNWTLYRCPIRYTTKQTSLLHLKWVHHLLTHRWSQKMNNTGSPNTRRKSQYPRTHSTTTLRAEGHTRMDSTLPEAYLIRATSFITKAKSNLDQVWTIESKANSKDKTISSGWLITNQRTCFSNKSKTISKSELEARTAYTKLRQAQLLEH